MTYLQVFFCGYHLNKPLPNLNSRHPPPSFFLHEQNNRYYFYYFSLTTLILVEFCNQRFCLFFCRSIYQSFHRFSLYWLNRSPIQLKRQTYAKYNLLSILNNQSLLVSERNKSLNLEHPFLILTMTLSMTPNLTPIGLLG